MKAKYILILIAIISTSCSKSVLSDMEITDPHLLKVKVKIEQNVHDEREVQVFIRDRNNRPIDLLAGKVIVNEYMVPFDRAEVNAAGARGYIYQPCMDEQIFKITIYWNSYDSHTFILSPQNGWPGFRYPDCSCNYNDPDYIYDSYSLKPAPFYDHEIDIVYNIINW
ncbi:hypothetical protein KDU71_18030 [Carboxylicivirga sediminis]|uniref:Uncharacterized protein n=1 Tax=Carboxylicivirga sediminis TaxID=2006564 RepID=A0A941F806_9BACT|nr:hypothetical protein [Carboxylicivirga sediminis]MBR8537473.1 hypothetical protein [Carboxylicivirga sediminis]